jgi:hypothetical protein
LSNSPFDLRALVNLVGLADPAVRCLANASCGGFGETATKNAFSPRIQLDSTMIRRRKRSPGKTPDLRALLFHLTIQ